MTDMTEGPDSTVTRTVCVSTNVSTIEEAFAFVITHMDAERLAHPQIEISPLWEYSAPDEVKVSFNVQVQGEQVRSE